MNIKSASSLSIWASLVMTVTGQIAITSDAFAQSTPPTITRQPVSETVYYGWAAVFKVSASGTPPLSYQWLFNGTNLPGATDAVLTVNTLPSTAGNYSVQITNAVGSVLSATVGLTCFSWSSPPPLPEGMPLDYWPFDDTNAASWWGVTPLVATNVTCVPSWSSNALLLDSTNPAILQYPTVETYGDYSWYFLACDYGTIEFWFRPDWSGTNMGGTGPGSSGRLIEVGTWTTNASYGWWALYLNPEGTKISFSAQNGGVQADYLTANIGWISNEWYSVTLKYSSNSTALYLDGNLVTNGLGVTVVPSAAVQAAGFRIGSDTNGLTQARGQFENLWTFDYPLADYEVFFAFDDDWPQVVTWTPPGGGDMPFFGGPLGNDGPLGGSSSDSQSGYTVGLRITSPVVTNGNLSVSIYGHNPAIPYDIYFATNLNSPIQWALAATGTIGQTNYAIANIFGTTTNAFLIAASGADVDGDGLKDGYEALISHTNPFNADTDVDGMSDGWEVAHGLNPLVSNQPYTPPATTLTITKPTDRTQIQ